MLPPFHIRRLLATRVATAHMNQLLYSSHNNLFLIFKIFPKARTTSISHTVDFKGSATRGWGSSHPTLSLVNAFEETRNPDRRHRSDDATYSKIAFTSQEHGQQHAMELSKIRSIFPFSIFYISSPFLSSQIVLFLYDIEVRIE